MEKGEPDIGSQRGEVDQLVNDEKSKVGRPAFVLSDKDLEMMRGIIRLQATQAEICGVFGVTDKTLNKALLAKTGMNFSEHFGKERAYGKVSLRRMQWKSAEAGSVPMQIHLGRHELGQTDKVALSGVGGGPLQIEAVVRTIVDPKNSDA